MVRRHSARRAARGSARGHNTPPAQNDKGEYACDFCGRGFPSISSLGGHRRFCDGGMWRCAWCHLSGQECGNKSIGPDGPATLCTSCSQRWKSGHSGPPPKDETGRFVCEECARTFDTISGLGSHRARCDGGVWRCEWCNADYASTTGKVRWLVLASHHPLPSFLTLTPAPTPNHPPYPHQGPGPNGAKTLCSACSARFRGGASGPPTTNEQGKFVCEECGRAFDTISGLGSHRARCDGGVWRCEWCNADYASSTGKVRWLVLASHHPHPSSLTLTSAPSTPAATPNHPALPSPGPRPQRSQDALLRVLRPLPRRRQRAAHHQRPGQVRVRLLRAHLRHVTCGELAQASVRRRQVAVRLVRVQGGRVYGQGPGAGRPEYTMCQLLGEVPQRRDRRRQARRQGELPLRLWARLCDQRGAWRPPAQLQAAGWECLPGGGRHLLGHEPQAYPNPDPNPNPNQPQPQPQARTPTLPLTPNPTPNPQP